MLDLLSEWFSDRIPDEISDQHLESSSKVGCELDAKTQTDYSHNQYKNYKYISLRTPAGVGTDY